MTHYRNLLEDQYQVGSIVMGRGTNIIVEEFDINSYDIDAQDYQRPKSDETNFGNDSFKATPIAIKMHVLKNRLMPGYENIIPNFWKDMPTAEDLALTWRADAVRKQWGELSRLYYGTADGGRVIFGRFGQFKKSKPNRRDTVTECQGEFRRADTLNYSAKEYSIPMTSNAAPQYLTRLQGNVPTWFRVVGQGPITNPVIYIGELEIRLNVTIAADELFELSTYPWQRRVVKSNGLNITTSLQGTDKYLDKMMIPYLQQIPVRWTSQEIGMIVPSYGNENWLVDIQDLQQRDLPNTFDIKAGKPVVRLDWLNNDNRIITKYISSGAYGRTSSVRYALKKFNTSRQRVEGRIIEPYWGRSAIGLMSNDAMTNYVIAEVQSGGGTNNWLRIRYGTSPTAWSAPMGTQWQHPNFGGWDENDKIAIGAEPIPGNPTRTRYTAYHNGVARCVWDDTTGIVNTSATNRSQVMIFDMDGTLLSQGTGWADIVGYDTDTTPAQTGKMYLYWRDAWGSI